MKRQPKKPAPDEARPVALTRAEATAIMEALYNAAIRAAMNDQLYGVEREAHRKVAALWLPTVPRRKP